MERDHQIGASKRNGCRPSVLVESTDTNSSYCVAGGKAIACERYYIRRCDAPSGPLRHNCAGAVGVARGEAERG